MQWRNRSLVNQISIVDAALTAAFVPSGVKKLFSGDVDGQVTNFPSGPCVK